ncbi:MAG: hypothetical protein CO090_04135 [Acidobacteria bacterium CG_4_9_14_3_um_filter_49_7]|nr:MAG: hypothetical protein CO090_04135 [Acidobacteria bacterium CG_4_9_14_3_um_filter_49_7]
MFPPSLNLLYSGYGEYTLKSTGRMIQSRKGHPVVTKQESPFYHESLKQIFQFKVFIVKRITDSGDSNWGEDE